jgi:hypothetical protein
MRLLGLLLLCGLAGCGGSTTLVTPPIKNEVCPVLVTATSSGSIVATTTVMLTVQSKTLDNGCQWQ